MTPTTTNLNDLAALLTTQGRLLATPRMQQALQDHYELLAGNGLKAAVTDSDGGRTTDTPSQPEAAVLKGPARGAERRANGVARDLQSGDG